MIILVLVIALVALGFAVAGLRGAIWVPARTNDTESILRAIDLPPQAKVVEFGSGDGRNLALIHKNRPDAYLAGIEINPVMWLFSWLRSGRFARIILADGWRQDLSDYDVVITFLMPKFMADFEKKMINELKPGSIVISYTFELPNLTPILRQNNYFVYRLD